MPITSINPATGETVKSFQDMDEQAVQRCLAKAEQAFSSWRTVPVHERAGKLNRVAELLEGEQDALAKTITLEMGKPITASKAEVQKSAKACRYYAEQAEQLLAPEEIKTDKGVRNLVHYQPLGPVLSIMPWNFPYWQVFRFAAPALMAGNVVLLKHASNVPQCALAIEDLFRRAGLPDGAFQVLLIGSSEVSKVIEDPRVVAVTVTGSTAVGSKVASAAGKAIKKSVLELGGSDPFIVMPSADIKAAAAMAAQARCVNSGQSCIAAKRFIVADSVADEFERMFVAEMEKLKVGDPSDPDTQVGPLSQEQGLADLQEQVQKTVEKGARVLTGGKRLDRPGWFYAPTVLTDIPKDSPGYSEEFFGPVGLVFRVPDAAAAIKLANDSPFGLGSSAWTQDEAEVAQFVDGIQSGFLAINGMVASDPRLPMGGVKSSGYGRELGPHGIREFVNVKTVHMKGLKSIPEEREE